MHETSPHQEDTHMKEVKIVLMHDQYTDYEDHHAILNSSITDWESISDADFSLLKAQWHRLEKDFAYVNGRVVLMEKDSTPVQVRIDSIRSWIDQERAKEEQAAQLKKQKAQEKALRKLRQDAASELALLQELKAKYPDV